MNFKEIANALKAKKIKIELNGHCVHPIEPDLFEMHYNIFNDLMLKATDEADKTRWQTLRDYSYPVLQVLPFVFDISCSNCGARLRVFLANNNTLSLTEAAQYDEIKEGEVVEKCKAADLIKAGKMVSEIEVPTGKLIFTNYFNTEKLYVDKEHEYDRSICNLMGRNHLMQYLAAQNVGYGQMGNMGIGVFVKDDGSEVIIGDSLYYDNEGYEKEIKHEGFKNIGDLSLAVWRWQCADKKVLEDAGEILPKLDKYLTAKVQTGKWRIEHYYDMDKSDNPVIYSKLFKI